MEGQRKYFVQIHLLRMTQKLLLDIRAISSAAYHSIYLLNQSRNHSVEEMNQGISGCTIKCTLLISLLSYLSLLRATKCKPIDPIVPVIIAHQSIPSAEIISPSILWLCSQADSQVALRRRVSISTVSLDKSFCPRFRI